MTKYKITTIEALINNDDGKEIKCAEKTILTFLWYLILSKDKMTNGMTGLTEPNYDYHGWMKQKTMNRKARTYILEKLKINMCKDRN